MDDHFELNSEDVINGKFEVVDYLAEGSNGEEIYSAKHLDLGCDVLIRVLPVSETSDESIVQRFLQQIKLNAVLQHPNILTAYEAGEHDGRYFLVTARESGCDMNEFLEKRGELNPAEACEFIRQLASGLEYAWAKEKVVHRNIKPETILVCQGNQPKLTDFGMAKTLTEDRKNLTMAGMTIGNPQYMSPEQVQGEKNLDFRSDVYCLGLIFYQLLVGSPPFEGKSQIELMNAHLKETQRTARQMNPKVPESCSKVVDKMLMKNREDRHASWAELIADLDALKKGTHPPSLKGCAQKGKGFLGFFKKG